MHRNDFNPASDLYESHQPGHPEFLSRFRIKLGCRRAVRDRQPAIDGANFTDVPQPRKRNMSGRYNHSFADGELELAQTGFGSLTWRCVIGNGHLRMRELHLTRMNDVPPNEKRVAGVLYEVGCMARRVARLTDRGDARNQRGVLLDARYLPGPELWNYCCTGM